MKITFLGTRGNIDARTRRHKNHTVTLISYKNKTLAIDWGLDWLHKINKIKPSAIIITHAHPDHAWGLKEGAPCPVFATRTSWRLIKKYPIAQQYSIAHRIPFTIGPFVCEAFPVIHSLRAPAVGYRISAGSKTIFCAHDLIKIKQQKPALENIELYIGDGATLTRPIIRQKEGKLFGHTTIRAQLGWCEKEHVSRAIFTHCGSQIVTGDERVLGARVKEMGKERNVDARIAYDGLVIKL